MFDLKPSFAAIALVVAGLAHPALGQDRALSFSLTGGAGVAPRYFGADDYRVSPAGRLGFTGLRVGSVQLGDPDGPARFVKGTRVRGALRYIPERKGRDELAGLKDVDAALEIGLGLHHAAEWWEIYGDLRYGVIGHNAIAGEIGANLIYRADDGLTIFAGPRADFGNARFARTYFGMTDAEAAALPAGSDLAAYRPSGGFHSVGMEVGAYQPLSADWGISGMVRYDRLRGDAAASPIVQQGTRNQISAEIGLTRHFNLRF